MMNFDDAQRLGKEGMDATMEALAAASKGAQTLAAEWADYSRRTFDLGSGAVEKLVAARTVDRALEVQTEYARSAYEDFVTQATKLGELYADVAKQAYKPFESYAAKAAPRA